MNREQIWIEVKMPLKQPGYSDKLKIRAANNGNTEKIRRIFQGTTLSNWKMS